MNMRVLYYLYKLRKNLLKPKSQLLEMQKKQLRFIVKYAYENVPFYHTKFTREGVNPSDVRSISDLAKFPLTTKQELQATPIQDLISRNFDVNKCITKITSGSTGVPLKILADKARVDFEEALWLRALFENGLRIRDKLAVISDPMNFPKRKSVFQRLGIMRSKYLSVFDNASHHATTMKNFGPDVLKGFPSSLMLLAEEFEGKDFLAPRLLFTVGELLDKASRKKLGSISQSGVLDNYSCSEFNLMAWECQEHDGYHINADSIVLEFVRNGEVVGPGERGEIICTNLSNLAMPLIRYRIGDVGVSVEDSCSCGRSLPLINIIEGRIGDFLVTTDNRLIPPVMFFPFPFSSVDFFEKIKQFRILQESKNEVTIQLAVNKDALDNEILENARKEIKRVFGLDMKVNFEVGQSIKNASSGKLKKIFSSVSIDD